VKGKESAMTEAGAAIDLTEQPTTLVYITKLEGNGVVAGYGYLKKFAFDIPTALRRLADAIEKGA
jgi:hypothetical protein